MIKTPETPLVSIIIPTYEQEDMAVEAALSALAQDHPRLEVIAVDDASPRARYRRLQAIDDPRFRYVRRSENVGRTENYRSSLRDLARGDWAMILDGDDYLIDNRFVSEAMQAVAEDPDIVIVAARSETHAGGRIRTSDHPGDKLIAGLDLLRAIPDRRYFFRHLATIYRRADALALDFYRSSTISSDWESLYRLVSHGKVRFLDRVVGVWRGHDSNASSSDNRQALIDNLDIWQAIYAEAAAQGLSSAEADRARKAMARFLMRDHIPRVASSWEGLASYLRQLQHQHPSAVPGIFHPPTLARLGLALLGYYAKK